MLHRSETQTIFSHTVSIFVLTAIVTIDSFFVFFNAFSYSGVCFLHSLSLPQFFAFSNHPFSYVIVAKKLSVSLSTFSVKHILMMRIIKAFS